MCQDKHNMKGKHDAIIYGTHFPNKLFVGCLPYKVTNEDLTKRFQEFGKIIESKIVLDSKGNSKRFGFVTFDSSESVEAAIKVNIKILGRKVNVGRAVRKEEKTYVPTSAVRIIKAEAINPNSTSVRYRYDFPTNKKDDASNTVNQENLPVNNENNARTESIIRSNNQQSHQNPWCYEYNNAQNFAPPMFCHNCFPMCQQQPPPTLGYHIAPAPHYSNVNFADHKPYLIENFHSIPQYVMPIM